MDYTLDNITTIVQDEVAFYASGGGFDHEAYLAFDDKRQVYTALTIPHYPRKFPEAIIVMARVVEDTVFIDADITDRPLVHELVRAGIPREQIICTYLGETVPESE